ncbi:MAG TPA: hypothetical protein PKA06_15200, partial [Gemmatales bacterium]|nr:hypothetical protein [Gemmatales bacterium]
MKKPICMILVLAGLGLACSLIAADTPSSSQEQGYQHLTTKAFVPAIWPRTAYDNAWKAWKLNEKPADFEHRFMERYGLHPAPYPNDGLPMGLRSTSMFGIGKGITSDCMMCHGGSIFGKSYIGLGNTSREI